jgi:indolepyruvate ferredoxin oxidoreductase beta subunit
MQQIAISGLGGQGVLFVTKLLADTALDLGHSVLISETHGMAQRGGNVISHLKISGGDAECPRLRSPLIRPGKADLMLVLHPDGLAIHGFYLKPGGWIFCNRSSVNGKSDAAGETSVDANGIALELGAPVCANLVLLGYAAGSGRLFCRAEQVEATLRRAGGKRSEINLTAFRAGLQEAERRDWRVAVPMSGNAKCQNPNVK